MSEELRTNPYVGLRPFFVEDSLYFYGREQQVAELLGILRQHRFLSVVGSSGSGKSSLVRAGLLPGLLGGFLVQDRDRWCTVQIKPGDAPIANLAAGLVKAWRLPDDQAGDLERRIRDSHADAVAEFLSAALDARTNVFILVDQFEEIFAFRGGNDDGDAFDAARRKERTRRRAEAAGFVDLLLRLAERRDLPIYVALTMRTDFLGECDLFYGLPEALNRGRYLVPRLTREQLRDAVECPALLLGAEVAPRLIDHVLNELGDRADRLPVLQHALLRTWDEWDRAGRAGPIDIAHYQRAGGLEGALNQDAERALDGLDRDAVARVFKRLTDTDSTQRRVRSPARISELVAASGADQATVAAIVDRFEGGGRSFVHRSSDGDAADPRIDISHESLIRQWASLTAWVDEERASSETFEDLVIRARKHLADQAALLHDPELRLIADWRTRERPSAGWAQRYSHAADDYAVAIGYLDESILARSRDLAELELARQWRRRWAPALVAILAAIFIPGASRMASVSSEGPRAEAASALATTKIRELTWTTSDSHQPMTRERAARYCLALPVIADAVAFGEPAQWRLPTPSELLDIYSPDDQANGFGRKVRKEFHRGVTSDYVWSDEYVWSPEMERPAGAVAADFKRQLMITLPAEAENLATALCVTSSTARSARAMRQAEIRSEIARNRNLLIGALLYLGMVLTIYYGLATAGRRIQRKAGFDRLVRMFEQNGGRHPRDLEAGTPRDALAVHQTIYAPTVRRIAARGIDVAVYVAFMIAAASYISSGGDLATVVAPDGTVMEGTIAFDEADPGRARFTSDEGEIHVFETAPPPQYQIVETRARPIQAALPSGAPAQAYPFARHLVRVKTDDGASWYGTFAETEADSTMVTVRYTPEHWQRTKDEFTADLLWRFGESAQGAETVAAETAGWIQRNPQPAGGAELKFLLRGYEIESQIPRPTDGDLLTVLGLGWLFAWGYESALLASRWQATIGMRIAGIMRTDLHGGRLSIGRAAALFVYRLGSYLTFGIGLLIQPFSRRRQALHDRLAGSVVLRRPRPGMAFKEPTLLRRTAWAGATVVLLLAVVLAGVFQEGAYQVAMSSDGSAGTLRWDDLGIDMSIGELSINGERITPGIAEQPDVTMISGRPAPVALRSTLAIALPGRCPEGACPVGFAYGIDAIGTPTVASITLGSTDCRQPVARAAASAETRPFEYASELPSSLAPGLYEFWVDFVKITSCSGTATTAGESPTRVPIALIEVK